MRAYRVLALADPQVAMIERDSIHFEEGLVVLDGRLWKINHLGAVVDGGGDGLFNNNGFHSVCVVLGVLGGNGMFWLKNGKRKNGEMTK